jgi:predicted murein hydrolase (TIGR00659 family)
VLASLTLPQLYAQPIFGVGVTVLVYLAARALQSRIAWLHPLVVACSVLIGLLVLARVPYASYKAGGDVITFFLGPATVALAVPLYKKRALIRAHWLAIVVGVTAGAVTGLIAGATIAWALLLHRTADHAVIWSMAPKSVTTPIAMELARLLGGVPELTAVLTVLTGLVGSVVGPWLLRRVGVRSDVAIGVAMGTAAHGIGTARAIRESEAQGSVAGLAMAVSGIITSLLVALWTWR